jgi:hypothetical protein
MRGPDGSSVTCIEEVGQFPSSPPTSSWRGGCGVVSDMGMFRQQSVLAATIAAMVRCQVHETRHKMQVLSARLCALRERARHPLRESLVI